MSVSKMCSNEAASLREGEFNHEGGSGRGLVRWERCLYRYQRSGSLLPYMYFSREVPRGEPKGRQVHCIARRSVQVYNAIPGPGERIGNTLLFSSLHSTSIFFNMLFQTSVASQRTPTDDSDVAGLRLPLIERETTQWPQQINLED